MENVNTKHLDDLRNAEIRHRIGNIFTQLNAIVRGAARSAGDVEEMARNLANRLDLLALSHRQSIETAYAGSRDLSTMIKTAIAPYQTIGSEDRRTMPQARLTNLAASTFCLVLYELATNSAKYGALRDGREVHVEWTVTNSGLTLDWREEAVLEADTPPRAGFGLSMVKSAIADILEGTATVSAEGEDLRWRITIGGHHLLRR
ncbi:MAG: HWE histidine kinase domain-containing protein [Pseudomonadota bacterium]